MKIKFTLITVLALALSAQAMAKGKKAIETTASNTTQSVSAIDKSDLTIEKSETKIETTRTNSIMTKSAVGFHLGANLSKSNMSDGTRSTSDNDAISTLGSATLGARASFALNPYIAFQPEFSYMKKGMKQTLGEDEDFGEISSSLNLHYLELSALLRAQIPNNSVITPYLLIGPSFGYLAGKSVTVDASYGGTRTISIPDSVVNDFEVSANAGLGMGIDLKDTVSLFFEARYQLGLTNVLNTDSPALSGVSDNVSMKNRGMQILGGVLFAI